MSEYEARRALVLEIAGGDGDLVRDAERHARMARELDRSIVKRVEQPRAACIAAFEARFGALPTHHREKFDCLPAKSLALTTVLIGKSENLAAFNEAFSLLTGAFGEGKVAGARQVLRALLEERFGPLEHLHAVAVEAAEAVDLDGCYRRFREARTALDVLGPLLPDAP